MKHGPWLCHQIRACFFKAPVGGSRELFHLPQRVPCRVGGSGVGCPDLLWGSHRPKLLRRGQVSRDHRANKSSHAGLAHVLGKPAFEVALGWSGNLDFGGRVPAFPGPIRAALCTCTVCATRMVCAEHLLSPGSLEFGSVPGRGCLWDQPPVKSLELSSGSPSESSTWGWSWRPPTLPYSLGICRDEVKVLAVLRGSRALEHPFPIKRSLHANNSELDHLRV